MHYENETHYEIERRFLIRFPNLEYLSAHAAATDITQVYLTSESGDTDRVRKRGRDGEYSYTHTVKHRISGVRRIEQEREISGEEYGELLKNADPSLRCVEKRRWCLEYGGRLFEIDIFPFWTDRAIVEIELTDEAQTLSFPPEIEVIREITDDGRYTNVALASAVPYDEI